LPEYIPSGVVGRPPVFYVYAWRTVGDNPSWFPSISRNDNIPQKMEMQKLMFWWILLYLVLVKLT